MSKTTRTTLAGLAMLAVVAVPSCGGSTPMADEVTVTKPAPAPVTVTEQAAPKAPKVCLDAVDDMDSLRALQVKFERTVVLKWPDIALDSMRAGFDQSTPEIQAITVRVKAINAQIHRMTNQMRAFNVPAGQHAADCRAAG